jgi:hypothetical protein
MAAICTYLLALILALPTGWCCIDYATPSGNSQPVKARSGCPMCAGRSAPDRSKAPVKSKSCCCEVRATPAKSTPSTVSLDAQPAFVVARIEAAGAGEAFPDQPAARGPTIPLHVLACVWLC